VDIVYKWYLPTLSEVIAFSELMQESKAGSPTKGYIRAEREWSGAIAALNQLFQQSELQQPDLADLPTDLDCAKQADRSLQAVQGLVLSGPSPVLAQPEIIKTVSAWTFTSAPVGQKAWTPLQLPPAAEDQTALDGSELPILPLLPNDPLASERFCLVLTPRYSLVMALGELEDYPASFWFSFDPEVVWQAWRSLRSRLLMVNSPSLSCLDSLVKQFSPVAPDYRTVMQFSRLMLTNLPEPFEREIKRDFATSAASREEGATLDLSHSESRSARSAAKTADPSWQTAIAQETIRTAATELGQDRLDKLAQAKGADTELLQAIAHEIRTPLTTIRTLTRSLLKRKDLNPDVLKRLEIIDHECTEQINRFNLIFRAVELETSAVKRPLMPLTAISLAQVFQQNVPRWQQQASQRNLTLDVILPQKLPMVVADPTMLDQVLTGLIDRITHSLPPGSRIQVHVSLAGHQLKLQFQSDLQAAKTGSSAARDDKASFTPTLKSLGQLLMFQPETGSLSLNLSVTKNLFQALGGKLIVRQKPQQGEVLTIFLPLETRTLEA
jgi:signal transduction histidine kinase